MSAEIAELGEGARWDAERGELLWVDILAGVLRRAVEDGDGLRTVQELSIGEPLGAVAPLASGDGWLCAAGRGFRHLGPGRDGDRAAGHRAGQGVRMNDAACDPQGRFWAGSVADDQRPGGGQLLRCDPDGTVRTMLPRADVANGLGWSPDGRTLYHADSGPRTVTAYDPETDDAGRVLIRPDRGAPDGLTVDDEGALWVALHGAGEVRRYAPDGSTLSVWPLPVTQPTSVAIGGAERAAAVRHHGLGELGPEQRAARAGRGPGLRAPTPGSSAPPVRPYRGALPRNQG